MKKIFIFAIVAGTCLPLISSAVTSIPTTSPKSGGTSTVNVIKKRMLSGEIRLKRQNSMSGKTLSGRTLPPLDSFSGVIEKPKVKSRLETAAERQRQRETDLENQHKEQQEQEDRQRAIKAAYDALKQAEEKARQAELEKRQPNESIEEYCARAERQGFLSSKWKVTSISECIMKLKNLEKVGRKIVENRMKNAMEQKKLGDRLKKLCIDEYTKTRQVPEYCANIFSSTSGSGTTQSGGVLTTR